MKHRFSTFLLVATYLAPLTAIAVTYTRVGVELWGSKAIGERTTGQEETTKSKRKVSRNKSTTDTKF